VLSGQMDAESADAAMLVAHHRLCKPCRVEEILDVIDAANSTVSP